MRWAKTMTYYEAVESTLNYIEEHLTEEIKLEALASRVYISKFHFYRIFKALTGYSVADYHDRRRLNQSRAYLKNSQMSILEIALELGYNSHEVLSRKFKRYYGMTPSQFRNSDEAIDIFDRISVIERDFFNKNNELVVKFEIREMPEKKVYGKACNNSYNDAVDPNTIGNFLFPFAEECFKNDPEGSLYLAVLYHEKEEEAIEYFVGFEGVKALLDFETLEIKSSQYAVFKYKGVFRENIKAIMTEIYRSIAATKWQFKDNGLDCIEVYDIHYLETLEFEIHVPVE